MELWDIYNEKREKTGRTGQRGDELLPGEYHLVVHVCLFNSRNEMLIQQRQTFKKGWPGLWDVSVGGSALAGESSWDAAKRETAEELGYRIESDGERPFFTVNFTQGFDDYYLMKSPNLNLEDLTLQQEEVKDARWATRKEIHSLREEGLFVPYHGSVIDLIFEMKESRGAILP